MKIKMLVSMAGPAISLNVGDEHECDDAEAMRLIAAGFAVPVSEMTIERAVFKPARAEKRTARRHAN